MAADPISFATARQRGSVTLLALCLSAALGIALTSYLAICSRSSQFSSRLLQMDRAQELAQVGLEEALWALNQNDWTSSGPAGTSAWTTSGASRTLMLSYPLSGGATGQVSLTIANYASTGPTWPSITSAVTITVGGSQQFRKTLQATTAPAPLFGNAIASAESYVSFTAAGTVDSWNSDPDNNPATPSVAYSFTANNPANYNAVIAGNTNGTYGVALTQATVRGYVATFGMPVSYSTSGTPSGSVVGPTTPAAVKVDTSRIGKSAFVPLSPEFEVTIPPAAVPPSSGGGGLFGLLGALLQLVFDLVDALLSGPGDSYKTSGDVDIVDASTSLTVNRPMKLVVNGNLTISASGNITITPTGSLELFVTGDVTIGGGGIRNQTGLPKKMALFCTSTSTTNALEFTTSQSYCGVIFCENKPIDIRQNATFYGALLSRQYVRFSTNATAPIFHYDSALRNVRFNYVTTPYIIQSVTES